MIRPDGTAAEPAEGMPLDVVLAIAGLMLSIVLGNTMMALRVTSPLGLIVSTAVASAGHLALRRSSVRDAAPVLGITRVPAALARVIPALSLVACVVAATQLLTVVQQTGARPGWAIVLFAVLPAVLFVQALRLPDHGVVFAAICVVSCAVALAAIVSSPHDGGDTWTHLYNAQAIASLESLSGVTDAYRDYPLYPGTIATLSSLSGVDPAIVVRALSIVFILSVLALTYVTARLLWSPEKALIAALLLGGSKWFIYWGSTPVAMQFSTILFAALLALCVRWMVRGRSPRDQLLAFVIAGVIPFFHPVVAVSAVILIVACGVAGRVARRAGLPSITQSLAGIGFAISIIVVAQWMYFGDEIFDRSVRSFADAAFSEGDVALATSEARRSLAVTLFDDAGFYILIALAGLGILAALRARRDDVIVRIGAVGAGFVAFGYGLQLLSFTPLVPDRWVLFGTLLLVYPATTGFVEILHGRHPLRQVAGAAIVSLLFLTAMTNNQLSTDRAFYGTSIVARPDLTDAEVAGGDFLTDVAASRPVMLRTDSWLWNYWRYQSDSPNDWYWGYVALDEYVGLFANRPLYADYGRAGYSDVSATERELAEHDEAISQLFDSGDVQVLEHAPGTTRR